MIINIFINKIKFNSKMYSTLSPSAGPLQGKKVTNLNLFGNSLSPRSTYLYEDDMRGSMNNNKSSRNDYPLGSLSQTKKTIQNHLKMFDSNQ